MKNLSVSKARLVRLLYQERNMIPFEIRIAKIRDIEWERGPDGEAILGLAAMGYSYSAMLSCYENDEKPSLTMVVHKDRELIYFDMFPLEWSDLAKSRIVLMDEEAG